VPDQYDFDHVAIAAADTSELLRTLTGRFGGMVLFGGQAIGFRPMQVWLGSPDGDGMKLELLEPWATEENDFLARFVARHGAGPHHLTFKVPDLLAAVERVRAAGFHPVQIDVSDPEWREAFLMPREAHGTVVQLAEYDGQLTTRAELLAHVAANGPDMNPRWWVDPLPPGGERATLRRVVVRTPSLVAGLSFFAGVLQGTVDDESADTADLVWPAGARVRLEAGPDAQPGVDRLVVEGLDDEITMCGTRFSPK
jgi:catechol 2,3-dioxygenase-like lactoylglutathione lyase family enzyme